MAYGEVSVTLDFDTSRFTAALERARASIEKLNESGRRPPRSVFRRLTRLLRDKKSCFQIEAEPLDQRGVMFISFVPSRKLIDALQSLGGVE